MKGVTLTIIIAGLEKMNYLSHVHFFVYTIGYITTYRATAQLTCAQTVMVYTLMVFCDFNVLNTPSS